MASDCHTIRSLFVLPIICAVLLVGCQAERKTSTAPAIEKLRSTTDPANEHPLRALRAAFRQSYDNARDQVDASMNVLVVVRFSDMFLVKNGKVVERSKGIPEKYHLLALTAHVPLMVTVSLRTHLGKPLPDDVKKDLAVKLTLIEPAISDLGNYGFAEDEVAWQLKVLTETQAFLRSAMSEGVTEDALRAYLNRVTQPMMELAGRAGEAQVDATHAAMTTWRNELTDAEWKNLRVIIIGLRQARDQYAQTQYFAALFPDRPNSLFRGENRRVIYVEEAAINRDNNAFKVERGVAATVALDESASTLIFNNPDTMAVDIMAEGARHRIAQLALKSLGNASPKDAAAAR